MEHTNRLINETSPYLLQHAHNPVDWYPWGAEALDKAKQENKPILLSIGYSACHWCHVMAHDSFEDPETAKIMNDHFINIKVDREERPDLDKVYQMAHQILIRRPGGWPLTVFLTPEDQLPFFVGTYFPREQHYQLPAFKEVMAYVVDVYHQQREEITKQNNSLTAVFSRLAEMKSKSNTIDAIPLSRVRDALSLDFDRIHGGFGGAPKFPHPGHLERLLRDWFRSQSATEDSVALNMVEQSLMHMAQGGVYDQMSGGFYRYAVDAQWMIPHFEKMLYDNALLLPLYAQLYYVSHKSFYLTIADEIAAWCMREMQAENGAYYAAIDADSEKREGKFYIWNHEQLENILIPLEYQIISKHFGLNNPPNFEGQWHFYIAMPLKQVAKDLDMTLAETREQFLQAKQKLFKAREQRIHPAKDQKILTAWNGLMIKGMTIAGRCLQRQDLIDSAEQALTFIQKNLWINNRLLAVYTDNQARFMGYLDDYVFLLDAVLELLQIRWKTSDLKFAIALADCVLDHFEDTNKGGFFFTANDHERLIYRTKSLSDEATPSGNGIAAYILNRLGYLTGNLRYTLAAENTLKAAWNNLNQVPDAYSSLLLALEEYLHPPELIIIRGEDSQKTSRWKIACEEAYSPRRMVFVIPDTAKNLPDSLALKKPIDDCVAYFCRGHQCSAPITSLKDLKYELSQYK
jgi:uncharacterized protein YyaL (SSP411 family)